MADQTDNESITEIVPKVLGQYLLDNIPALKAYYPEFPSPNRRISLPSVSIITKGTASFRPFPPYPKKDPEPADITNFKVQTDWVVGFYDLTLQLDLWTGSKEARDDIFDQIFNAMNPFEEIGAPQMGVVLPMEEYFDQLCSYLYTGHNLPDSAERSIEDEWRIIMDIEVSCNKIRSRKEFVIDETQVIVETKDLVEPF